MSADNPRPLEGVRVLELGGVGPTPFSGMLLSGLGATVTRVRRPGSSELEHNRVLYRDRTWITLDLKTEEGRERVLQLAGATDILIEGFRPGILEKLDLAPSRLWEINPSLVIGRMTGYGQTGERAPRAGHDINYIAVSGALHAIGRQGQPPTVPLNIVGDFGGGGMLLVVGVLAALHTAQQAGRGSVVDASMVDGTAQLLGMTYGMAAAGRWSEVRGSNLLDSGAPFYDVYECADGKWVAVGALEPQFFTRLVQELELDGRIDTHAQHDRTTWPAMRLAFAETFARQPRDWWAARLQDVDVCVTPVLSLREASQDDDNRRRGVFFADADAVVQPAPAPRFRWAPIKH